MKKFLSIVSLLFIISFYGISIALADGHNEIKTIPERKPTTIYVINDKGERLMTVSLEHEVFNELKLTNGEEVTLGTFLSFGPIREKHYDKKETEKVKR